MRRQSEQIKQMTDREVLIHLYITQGLLLLLAGGSSLFLFAREEWRRLWQFELRDVLVYGAGGAAFVLAAEFLAMRYLPDDWHDDGGVNEKIFRGRSIPHLFFFMCAHCGDGRMAVSRHCADALGAMGGKRHFCRAARPVFGKMVFVYGRRAAQSLSRRPLRAD